jgi:hypothetical protein
MDKENVAYIHTMEYSSVIKRNEIMSFAGKGIELEITMLSKISQSEKGKFTCMKACNLILKNE